MKLPFIFNKKEDASLEYNGLPEHCSGDSASQDDNQAIAGLSDLYFPQDDYQTGTDEPGVAVQPIDLADILHDMGAITPDQRALIRQKQSENPDVNVKSLLIEMGFIAAGNHDLYRAEAELFGYEFRQITPDDIDRQVFYTLDPDFIRSNSILPLTVENDVLTVATSEPENVFAIEEVRKNTQMDLHIVVCSPDDITRACEAFDEEKSEYQLDDIISDMDEIEIVQDQEKDFEDLEKMAGQSPVIKFVNYLISSAISEGASDIHIEPKEKITKIRYRIDGMLFESMQSPIKMHPAVVSRIKIMSNLDISERRLPQDGKISVIVGGRAIDLRISILPTSTGEKVVIRILDSKSIIRGLEHLGMEPEVMAQFGEQVKLPHGILLVTGPTGSGKSTTLYSALCTMDGEKTNISTVEDPVEYELDFCNQVQANEKIGLTFASSLRSLLRQDPDIIMIGEIRDNETARIAVQAALTGHLVLSTLHTNDAPSSITRLVNIGIDAYLIAASLNAVLAQRLVRKICGNCKKQYQVPENMRKYIERAGVDPNQLVHGEGCDKCRNSGYVGRVGIYELLVIDDVFRDMINKDPSAGNMRNTFYGGNAAGMFNDGIKKVCRGETTIEEILRVTEVYGMNDDEAFVENTH